MKKRTLALLSGLIILLLPLSQVVALAAIPSQFGSTYYAELSPLRKKLEQCPGKKVVILGNSSVAFGVDSALLEQELRAAGADYSVCNFGLYGAIGTKAMLDLAEPLINNGDVLVFAPEIDSQALSLYFSGKEMWYCVDSDSTLFDALTAEERHDLLLSVPSYNAAKYSCVLAKKAADSGTLYSKAAFDANGDLKNVERKANKMTGAADLNNPISFDPALFGSAFSTYVRSFAETVKKRGGQMYFSFCPMNGKALKDKTPAGVEALYQAVGEAFSLPIITSPLSSIMPPGWFYDSNFHLNGAGMTYHTLKLAEDLKNEWGLTSPLLSAYPSMPSLEETPAPKGNGDNSDAPYFLYQDEKTSSTLTGLTSEGSARSSLLLPSSHNDLPVVSFASSVFQNDEALTSVSIPENITLLPDFAFKGCSQLTTIKLLSENPESTSVGYHLLDGAPLSRIAVPQASLSAYSNDYFWGHYAGFLQGY